MDARRHCRGVRTYFGVNAKVFTASETNAVKVLLLLALFICLRTISAVVHQTLELRKGFLDLWDGSGAVDELPLRGIELQTTKLSN